MLTLYDTAIRSRLLLGTARYPSPAVLAEALAVRSILTFADEVNASEDLARLIRAAYDPVMPNAATDPSHAIRLAARMG